MYYDIEPEPAIYMEFMPLGNLRQAHNRHPFSFEETCEINYQSLSALSYLHQRDIGHRDIKPENILVKNRDTKHLHIVLSDFGFSKKGILQTYCGTEAYWPPEVEWQGPTYTKAVDIWSLGVVVLELAYGLPLRYARDTRCHKIAERARKFAAESLGSLLKDMLAMKPHKRPTTEACRLIASRLIDPSRALPETPMSTTSEPRTQSLSEVTLVGSQHEVSLLNSPKSCDPPSLP